jgi:hypothetical protein
VKKSIFVSYLDLQLLRYEKQDEKSKERLKNNFLRILKKNFKIGKILTYEFGSIEALNDQSNSRTFKLKNKIRNSRKTLALIQLISS